jgi:hypothetical protein
MTDKAMTKFNMVDTRFKIANFLLEKFGDDLEDMGLNEDQVREVISNISDIAYIEFNWGNLEIGHQ